MWAIVLCWVVRVSSMIQNKSFLQHCPSWLLNLLVTRVLKRKMPTFNIMPKEGVSLPRLSISVFMIIRLVLLITNCIIMAVIGYYFSNSRGSFRQSLFHEELMMLVCSIFAFITTIISMVSKKRKYLFHYF